MQLLRGHQLRAADFETDDGPPRSCRLTDQGRKIFLAAYERRMLTIYTHGPTKRRVSYRVGLSLQAQCLADEFSDPSRLYRPTVWK